MHLNEKFGDGTPLRSYDEYVAITKQYDEWWQPHSEKILKGLCDITGLEFAQNTIDVYVAPWFYAFSSPMVIGVIFRDKDELISVVSHEIVHRLLTDNTKFGLYHNYLKDWRKLFGKDHSNVTLAHIPVHAILEKLYRDILNQPDIIEIDKKQSKQKAAYQKSWQYVQDHGYDWIIEQLVAIENSLKN
mgnify:CR=1 FL=1